MASTAAGGLGTVEWRLLLAAAPRPWRPANHRAGQWNQHQGDNGPRRRRQAHVGLSGLTVPVALNARLFSYFGVAAYAAARPVQQRVADTGAATWTRRGSAA